MRLNLFVVESPLQALSACEAKDSLCAEDRNIVIVRLWGRGRKENDIQLKKVIGLSDWKEVIYFSTEFRTYFGMHLKIIIALMQFSKMFKNKTCNIFIGDFNSAWMHYLKCAVQAKKIFLLDDGTDTIAAYNNSISKNINWPRKNRGYIKQYLHNLMYSYWYDENVAKKKIVVFSSFHLCADNPFVIKNHYLHLKKKMSEKVIEDKVVYYFGAKYSESGVMTQCHELMFLRKVIDYYKNNNIDFIYIPHRDETASKITAIKKMRDVSIKNLNLPAELYLIINKNVPLYIGGAYTSVLQNVKVMFDCFSIRSFRIPVDFVSGKQSESIKHIYENYLESGIDVIDVNI